MTVSFDKTHSHLPPDDSTHEAVLHIHGWMAERKQLKQALESLKDESLKVRLVSQPIQTS